MTKLDAIIINLDWNSLNDRYGWRQMMHQSLLELTQANFKVTVPAFLEGLDGG